MIKKKRLRSWCLRKVLFEKICSCGREFFQSKILLFCTLQRLSDYEIWGKPYKHVRKKLLRLIHLTLVFFLQEYYKKGPKKCIAFPICINFRLLLAYKQSWRSYCCSSIQLEMVLAAHNAVQTYLGRLKSENVCNLSGKISGRKRFIITQM